MRHAGALALVLVCAASCLAKEYSITKSFDEDEGDDGTPGGAPSGGRGASGGTVSPPSGGEGGDDTGSGGSTGGSTSGTGGDETGGTVTGGIGGMSGGRDPSGGRGGAGGSPAGSSGKGGAGTSGAAGKGGTGGASTGGAGGSGGTTACGACIVHRYSFSGTTTTATDSVGTAHGTIVGGTQSGGVVTLAGGTADQYVSLPTSVLAGLTDVTLEFWVSWTGGTATWQRVFDFGSNDGAAGEQGSTNTSSSYFFFTPRGQATTASASCMGTTAGLPRVTYTLAGPASETCVIGAGAFPAGLTQVAVTVQNTTLSLYLNGAAFGTPAALPGTLTDVTRTNNWLGRSQFSSDTEFAGTISEFRVYSVARSASQIAASSTAGPDTPPTQ
jgi:hypothetical protein